jgi:Uma2 family endonuclease
MSVTATTPAAPKIYNPDDLLRLPGGGKGYELVDGELKEQTVSKESSRIGGNIFFLSCFRDDLNRGRKPDVAFIALDRMPPATYQDEDFCSTVPDRIVEVTSPNDLHDDVEEKL